MPADRLYEDLQFKDRNVYSNVNSLAAERSVAADVAVLQKKVCRWRVTASIVILLIVLIIAIGAAIYVSNYQKTKVGRAVLEQLKADVCIKGESPCRYCANEWIHFSGSCYLLSMNPMNWTESQKNCRLLKSTLAVVNNKEEEAFLEFTGRTITWIGLSRDVTGSFVWEDKSPLREENSFWQEDEPNDLSHVERCVELYPSAYGNASGWNDNNCNHRRHSFCETPTNKLTT